MSHLGEFELIGRISAVAGAHSVASDTQSESKDVHPGHLDTPSDYSRYTPASELENGVTGIGDDCAVIPQHEGVDSLITTDLLIEGRHFLLNDISPFELGWKSAAVNISDIAAMGGKPTAAFLSIALPKELGEDDWVDGFTHGFMEVCGRFGVALLGGDTSASPSELFINVTVLGECPHGRAVKRSGARPGDIIYVTGPLGDSAAGLKLILERSGGRMSPEVQNDVPPTAKSAQNDVGGPAPGTFESTAVAECNPAHKFEQVLIDRHYRPLPRVEMGLALRETPGVHAMMDISDGIASDLRHILKASGSPHSSLSAEIDLKSIPTSPEMRAVCAQKGWDAMELAVSGGEDYELLFTAAPGAKVPEGCVAIGRVTVGEGGIRWIGSDHDYQGFTHF